MEAVAMETDPLAEATARLAAFHAEQGAVSGRGLEALIAGATLGVSKKTWLLPGRRERGCAILRGCAAERVDEARPYRVVPPGESPAARALYGVGLALAGDPALVFVGSGSASYGAFLEALNLAALRKAPVTFVVAWYTNAGPFATQLAGSPAAVAQGFGLPARIVDGADAHAVRDAVGTPGVVEARLVGRG
jgi:pyruvate dehydrogenase E1 component alpha subunit